MHYELCIENHSILHVEHSVHVAVSCEGLVVGDDDERLVQLVAQVEEELV